MFPSHSLRNNYFLRYQNQSHFGHQELIIIEPIYQCGIDIKLFHYSTIAHHILFNVWGSALFME